MSRPAVPDESLQITQLRTVGLTLDTEDVTNVAANPEVWEKVVRKLRVGAMPPPPRPRPDQATYDGFRVWLETELDRVAAVNPDPGRTQAFHRLNRMEHRNVIRDLFDLDIDVSELIPADAPDEHGFDNNAGALSFSPALLERYVSAAHKISQLALGVSPTGPVSTTYDVPLNLMQDDRRSEDLPFGSRGGVAIDHTFPIDGLYRITVKMQTNYVQFVRGLDVPHDIEISLDGERLEQFTIGGKAPGTAYPISDVELASRLSFFLWSNLPDDELLALAEAGTLGEPAVLGRQVRRLLADDRASALIDGFVGQWLYLRNLASVYPTPSEFREFDENLREAFQRETEIFVDHQLRTDRSVLELRSADYTFVNERLARHYGIPNVYGNRFRRVGVEGGRRAGLLGHASLMTVTSYPNRTSPVLRGKFVLENLLGAPPPEPPPNIPALEETDADGKPRSLREAMEEHRESSACRVCHAPMDPIGFSLENFDAVGAWRTTFAGEPIDASGVLPDGSAFDGPTGLRDMLLARPADFVGTVTEKLMTYALGRRVEYYDMPTIRRIAREAEAADYRWSAVILGIIESAPFQMRRSES